MKKPICFLALICMLFSCNENMRFEQAQPADFPQLSRIPKNLRGTFQDDDSLFLIIDKKSITELAKGTFSETLEELAKDVTSEEEVMFKDSTENGFTAYLEDGNTRFEVQLDKKAGTGNFEYRDKRFSISDKNVIKSKDGAYYVNIYRPKDTAWILRKLVIKGDSLLTYKLGKPKEREALEALTTVRDHYKKDGELEGWKIDPSSDVLDLLFDQYGKRVKAYIKVK